MKAILVFDLAEDRVAHKAALQGMEAVRVLAALDERLCEAIDYGDVPDCAMAAYEQVRDWLLDLADDHGVEL